VVVTSSTYDQFRPEAGQGGGRGNDITFKARLQKTGGGEPSEKAIKFEWKFKDVSREPGYAMNMPVLDPDVGADLRFEASDDLRLTDHEGLSAETPLGEQRVESTAVIGSHDWGGFGSIEVTAVLPSGKRIQGILQGAGAEILVPKRTAETTSPKAGVSPKGSPVSPLAPITRTLPLVTATPVTACPCMRSTAASSKTGHISKAIRRKRTS
jgi:hypothetical protein